MLLLVQCHQATTHAPEIDQTSLQKEIEAQKRYVEEMQTMQLALSDAARHDNESRMLEVAFRIAHGGTTLCQQTPALEGPCHFRFKLIDDDALNAYADGETIIITSKMLAFTQTDEELAIILGHEYAHNMMGHVSSTRDNALAGTILGFGVDMLASAAGIGTGSIFSDLGGHMGSLHYSQEYEIEADYVGLYITALAGYDITNAKDIWRRFTVEHPEGMYASTTHPSNPHRYLLLDQTIEEIHEKIDARAPLIPEFIKTE